MKRIQTLLVANRGEIACRVFRTARRMGIRTVAVYSDADRDALHTRSADTAVRIGPPPANESYLDIEAILEAAQMAHADAIHPGYGFLSENAAFARACTNSGITFVGPCADAIAHMGSKRESKARMLKAGVPCIPGSEGKRLSDDELLTAATTIGFPVLVKASAGGGGRGLRRVHTIEDLKRALSLARSEAQSAFRDDELILERAVTPARHVEVQVFADTHQNVIHLGERDCSVQRRNQKVIEEAPGPGIGDALRQAMGSAAVEAAKAIGYVGAGTVEFLVDSSDQFYFMEMNTRLQVEHPVSECITGLDLVEWQLRVAQGEPLPIDQAHVRTSGHAIEVRLYAEDPSRDFLPQTGVLSRLEIPDSVGIRTDSGVAVGSEVTAHYDPMLMKIIAHGPDRESARLALLRHLETMAIHGVGTNQALLAEILSHDGFAAGAVDTRFLERHWKSEPPGDILDWFAIAGLASVTREVPPEAFWSSSGSLRSILRLRLRDRVERVEIRWERGRFNVCVKDAEWNYCEVERTPAEIRFSIGQQRIAAQVSFIGGSLWLSRRGRTFQFEVAAPSAAAESASADDKRVTAPMSGKVVEVRTQKGATVAKGDVLLVLEAMKMQMEVIAAMDGTIETLHAEAGTQVRARQILASIAP